MENKPTFIDFGCGKGETMERYEYLFEATPVLGIDTWEEHLEEARAKGYNVMNADLTTMSPFDLPRVNFATFIHVLEHMPDLATVARVISMACVVSKDFVYIRQPFFDADNYLAELGFKFNWSNWSCHPSHVTTEQFKEIASVLGYECTVSYRTPAHDTHDPNILPLSAPYESGIFNEYHPEWGEKPYKVLTGVYHETVCIIKLREYSTTEWNNLLKKLQ